jgi:hypothetical protein
MRDYESLPGYDAWISREPEYAEEPLPEEDELPEPTVEEVWDGGRGEYVHEVTFASGEKFTILQERDGAYAGDYSIHGKGYYADGYLSPEKAIDHLIDMVMS